jgi:hypothetical protein
MRQSVMARRADATMLMRRDAPAIIRGMPISCHATHAARFATALPPPPAHADAIFPSCRRHIRFDLHARFLISRPFDCRFRRRHATRRRFHFSPPGHAASPRFISPIIFRFSLAAIFFSAAIIPSTPFRYFRWLSIVFFAAIFCHFHAIFRHAFSFRQRDADITRHFSFFFRFRFQRYFSC